VLFVERSIFAQETQLYIQSKMKFILFILSVCSLITSCAVQQYELCDVKSYEKIGNNLILFNYDHGTQVGGITGEMGIDTLVYPLTFKKVKRIEIQVDTLSVEYVMNQKNIIITERYERSSEGIWLLKQRQKVKDNL
jgi:hypothetical protein